jgi:Ca2+-binding EF-hand superfamily protein
MDEIQDLIGLIDRRNTGMLEYNSFMSCVVPFLRKHYKDFASVSYERLKQAFDNMDINKDGTLNNYEFRHVMMSNSSNQPACKLTDEECDLMIKYLDVDEDNSLSWNEFKSMYEILSDPGRINRLPNELRRALRKVSHIITQKWSFSSVYIDPVQDPAYFYCFCLFSYHPPSFTF